MIQKLGVLGAGTMGAGIAQVALQAGVASVLLYDPSEPELAKAIAGIRTGLEKLAAKGNVAADVPARCETSLQTVVTLEDLAGCDMVIEAVPEELALKRDLFARLEGLVAEDAILASNTSSLPVTAIAGATKHPERVVGMHFFNPVPLMALVEVVSGQHTAPDVARRTVEFAERLGKVPVRAADTPGFIVNRVARPFYGEGLRLLGEGVSDAESIDRILREAGGFRMGPFELMDLIGIDVNFAVTQSVYRAFFEDPKYRPHPIQARMVQSGSLGRKSGRGFYLYPRSDEDHVEASGARGSHERVLLLGEETDRLARRLEAAGHVVVSSESDLGSVTVVVDKFVGPGVRKRQELERLVGKLDPGTLILTNAAAVSATEVASWLPGYERVVGIGLLGPWNEGSVIECARALRAPGSVQEACDGFWASLGIFTAWVSDRTGLVLARVLACLVNEAYSALMEGVATEADLDRAMTLGVNYPAGLIDWGRRLGLSDVVHVLEGLCREQGEDRYRVTPLLRLSALASQGAMLAAT